MKKIALSLLVILSITSCTSMKQLTPSEVRAMTTKQYESSYDVVFRSCMSLLQAEGFVVESTNKEIGLINGNKRIDNKNADFQRLMWGSAKDASTAKISIMVEEVNKELSEVKLTIYEGTIQSVNSMGAKSTKESMVTDAEIYTSWFNNLRVEIERRKATR